MKISHVTRNSNERIDATPVVRDAIERCRLSGDRVLEFENGRYDFWPEKAAERFLWVSNNDESMKRIVFPLFDFAEFSVIGNGAQFVFHGDIVPFAMIDSRNISLSGFSIDWERTFHSEAIVVASNGQQHNQPPYADLRFTPQDPFRVRNGRLVFLDENGKEHPFNNALEYDPRKRETAFRVYDNYALPSTHTAVELGPDTVRVSGCYGTLPTPGNMLSFVHYGRQSPAIAIADCSDIVITSVAIHHAGGMGVIAQRTRDIRLERIYVTPSPDKERIVSLVADATHFVNCAGKIDLIDCLFEGQMDDPVNVHGIYARISSVVNSREIEIELVHYQQQGIAITQPGDSIEISDASSLCAYHKNDVVSVRRINATFSRIQLANDLPSNVGEGDIVASATWIPDLTIRGCTARKNRARGFLISTAGKVVVEENTIHSPGAAILIAGDGNHWFESGPVRDIAIRNNHFDNCLYGVWGRAIIDINPEVVPEIRSTTLYHCDIRIENNTFTVFDERLVEAQCVDGLVFADNTIARSRAYPSSRRRSEQIVAPHCRNVVIQGNRILEKPKKARSAEGAAPPRGALEPGASVRTPRSGGQRRRAESVS